MVYCLRLELRLTPNAMGDGNRLFERKEFIVCLLFAIWVTVSVIAEDATGGFMAGGTFPECPTNEFYRACMDNCSNCEYRGKCPIVQCTKSGCDCRPHFVRLTPDGPCEPIRKCPEPTCQENEIFRPCGPVCETCARLRCRILSCEYKCYCKKGYLRNNDGKCIPVNDCPPRTRCSIGEEQGESGLVDEYCLHEDGEVLLNETEKKQRCYCLEGHQRNLMGHCSDEFFCEFNKCRNVEVFKNCPPKCNTTCTNYGDSNCEEDGQCYPGCFCPEGYVMNDYRVCVRVEECPPGSNPFAPTAAPTTLGSTTETPSGDGSTPMTPQPQGTTPIQDQGTTPIQDQGTTPIKDQGTTSDQLDSTGTTPGISTSPASSTTHKPKVSNRDKSNLPQKDAKGVTVEEMADLKKLSLVTPDFEEQNL